MGIKRGGNATSETRLIPASIRHLHGDGTLAIDSATLSRHEGIRRASTAGRPDWKECNGVATTRRTAADGNDGGYADID